MEDQLARYLTVPNGEQPLPHKVRVNQHGQASVIDMIMCVCFTGNDEKLMPNASNAARVYYQRLRTDNAEVATICCGFKFPGRGQQVTPVAGRNGMIRIIQLLRSKRAAKFRESLAGLMEKYLDADMGLAEDIIDRAVDARLTDIERRERQKQEQQQPAVDAEHHRLKSRDSTKSLGAELKTQGAEKEDYRVMNGTVNRAVTGMYTDKYRGIQVNLKKNEAAREAFTDGMSAMAYLANTMAKDGMQKGGSMDEQLRAVATKYYDFSKSIGLHEVAKVAQPREYIAGNKRIMEQARAETKRLKTREQAQQIVAPPFKPPRTLSAFFTTPKAIAASA
jgi:hypothetical protein